MTDLDLALEMLDSPDADERQKAIKMLARSGDREALYHLADAYKAESDPELRDLIQKAGRYLKKNLDAEQSTQGYAQPGNTQGINEQADSYTSKWDYDDVRKKKKNTNDESREPNTIVILLLTVLVGFCGFVFAFASFDDWLDLSAMPMETGISFGEMLENVKDIIRSSPDPTGITREDHLERVDWIRGTFGMADIARVLSGDEYVWSLVFRIDYLYEMADYYTTGNYPLVTYEGQPNSLDNMSLIGVFSGWFVCMCAIVIFVDLTMGRSSFLWFFGLLLAVMQLLGQRVNWVLCILFSIPCIISTLNFYFNVVPRFVPHAMETLGIATTEYNTLSILGPNFYLAVVTSFASLFLPMLALTFYTGGGKQ